MGEKFVDNDLVSQARRGDKKAFSLLVLKYQPKLMKVISRQIDNPNNASDILQESFCKAFCALDKFEGRSSFYTWLYRITINTTRNHVKSCSRHPPDSDIDIEDAEGALSKMCSTDFSAPDLLLRYNELQEAVLAIVNSFPIELRTSFILRDLSGLSYESISAKMKVPVGTVRSRIFRARHMLDERIKPYLND